MNWVLILILSWNGSNERVGPYASHADCEKAYTVVESQGDFIKQHFCVPRPYTDSSDNAPLELPKEFD